MPKKGSKKGKKGKGKGKKGAKPSVPVITTRDILRRRQKMLCPRLGDAFDQTMNVERILEDVAEKTIHKVMLKESKVLVLRSMRLSQLPRMDLSRLLNIVELDLSRNNLFNTEEVFGVRAVQCNPRGNDVTDFTTVLSQAVSQLENLQKLDVSYNYINGSLPEVVGGLCCLEEINLDTNHIITLPMTVSGWKHLRRFTISNNELTGQRTRYMIVLFVMTKFCACLIIGIPAEALHWTRIEYLNARSNRIKSLDNFIRFWSQIERLYMGNNELSSIPEEISYCSMLTEVDFSSNQIIQLPRGLSACVNIVVLQLGESCRVWWLRA